MSNATQLAAADIAKLRNMFAGFLAFGEGLEALGSIEQATNEANSRLQLAQTSLDAVNDAAEDTRKATDAAMGTAQTVLTGAMSRAEQIVGAAEQEAAGIVAHARSDAKAILHKADSEAEGLTAALETENADLVLAIATAKDNLAELNDSAAASQIQLDALTSAVTAVKAQIAALG